VKATTRSSAHQARAIIPWIGGKSGLADRIIALIPPHHCYVEVFAGAGSILFRKPESRVEILNDINLELVTLYRVIKNHLDEFIRYLRWLLTAREEFLRFKATDPATLTDVQRAVRLYYLMYTAFTPSPRSATFRCQASSRPKLNLLRIEETLSESHLRLSRVFIENLPYQVALERFDGPDTFFYLDPPYYGCEKDYGPGLFDRSDFARLAAVLRGVKAKFMLSLNDRAETRALFRGFTIRAVTTHYRVASARHKPARELLITNYRPGQRSRA
jgi:DNA adenine methylase